MSVLYVFPVVKLRTLMTAGGLQHPATGRAGGVRGPAGGVWDTLGRWALSLCAALHHLTSGKLSEFQVLPVQSATSQTSKRWTRLATLKPALSPPLTMDTV